MKIAEKDIRSLIASMLKIDEGERKIDWFDVLDIISQLEQTQKKIHELQTFKNHAEFHLPERLYDKIEQETSTWLLQEKSNV